MRIVMIGHGMVGHRFLENLASKSSEQHEVIVLAEEARPAYDRVQLSGFFSGKTAEEKKFVLSRTNFFVSCLLYTSPSPRDRTRSRMPSSA